LQIGLVGLISFSPNVAKHIKYIIINVNSEAMYIIPFISEFEMLSSTKKVESSSELETEMILNILDKDKSIIAIS
jgi:hypothetical protein